jgi:putative glutathione S-transferase
MSASKTDDTHKDGSTKWSSNDGRFRRQESSFRDEISKDGEFKPELNRYHLVAAMACPWAHRAMIVRKLKGLDKVSGLLPLHTVHSFLGPEGWTFVPYEQEDIKGLGVDGSGNKIPGHESKKRIRDLYRTAEEGYSARCTVPIIWDNKLNTIVNNESSEIIRNLNTCFNDYIDDEQTKNLDFYPAELRKEIDALNEWMYPNINNGVYKSGFATKQDAYEESVNPLFEHLDKAEKILSDGREYFVGDRLTEADIRLWTTIIRFDPVYVGHFKCNIRTIRAGYPHLHRWMRNLYWNGANGAFKDTTDFDSIKAHYYQSHAQINPTRIVPVGPLPHILPLDK